LAKLYGVDLATEDSNMKNIESRDELIARHDKHIENALIEYGKGSTPVFAWTLGKYYELQKHSIFSKIDEIKNDFSSYGGADKIVAAVHNSIIKFNDYETDEEPIIPFLTSINIQKINFSKETIIAASLYLLYFKKVINSKYSEVANARSKLVSALTEKNLRQEKSTNNSPTDLKNEDSELSKLSRLKKELKKLPETFQYLNVIPNINPDLKIYVEEIPPFFPNLDIHSVYLAAALWQDELAFEKYSNLSLEDRFQFASTIDSILPEQAWKYWLDDVEELFEPYFKKTS
jgi:hypothetical protein